MGGDHKCPVCEATFTRPQHVARHMRSHTGDRPYKCQYCGDQFARSDLLSRHVNKCHANEKPLPTTGLRKKGSASASRATTSKQVCDQCVQANTSCDGSNPCTKCIQRKYRCTFVKFHRQTAPVGPGHTIRTGVEPSFSNPPSPNSISAPSPSSRVPVYHHPHQQQQQQSEDDFILGPPPTVVPTMADALYGATPFTFPPLYPANDLSGDYSKYRAHAELFASTRSGMPASSSIGGTTTLSPNIYDPRPPSSWLGWGQQDATEAYQQQQQRHADLISDSAPPPPSLSPISSSMNDKDMQVELARHHHHQQHQQHSNPNPNLYLNVSYSIPQQSTTSNYHLLSDPNGINNGNALGAESSDSASSSAASSFVHLPLAGAGTNTGVDSVSARNLLVGGGYDNNGPLLIPDRRTTSSASSSSSSHHHHPDHHQNLAFESKQVSFPTHDENAFSSNQHHHQHQHQPHPHPHPHHHLSQQQVISDLGRPEFSSAFGLLSLDDPNVIAGMATDGAPFFDDPNQAHNQARSTISGSTTSDVVQLGGSGVADIDTPMPMKQGSGQLQSPSLEGSQKFQSAAGAGIENGVTPSREKDSKVLKELWKQYMRIPLSGSEMLSSISGSEGVTPRNEGVTPSGIGIKVTNTSGPGSGYRRPRVASLPTAKTPIVERDRDHLDAAYVNATHSSTSTSNAGMRDGQEPTAGTAYLRRTSSHEMPAGMGVDLDTGMDNAEDLRSYEAAVMARKAPTSLNLKMRRPMRGRGRGGGTGGGGKLRDEGSASASSGNSPRAMGSGDTTDCSSSSSLAKAFGTGRLGSHSRDQTVLSAPGGLPPAATLPFAGRVKKEESASPSLSPRASSAEGDDNQSEVPSPFIGNSAGRPSFKRLPSQTLGPDNLKRPFYGFGEEVEDRVVSGWGTVGNEDDGDDEMVVDRRDIGGSGGSSAERKMRKRRMSEPWTSLTGGGGGGFDRGEEKKSSRVDVSAVQNVDELWFTSY